MKTLCAISLILTVTLGFMPDRYCPESEGLSLLVMLGLMAIFLTSGAKALEKYLKEKGTGK